MRFGNACSFLLSLFAATKFATAQMQNQTCSGNEDNFPFGAVLAPGLCAQIYRKTQDLVNELSRPRSLYISKAKEVFCLERAGYYEEWANLTGYVMVYDDEGKDGTAETATVIARKQRLDHGLAVTESHVYASSSEGVFRWPYTTGQRAEVDNSTMEVVVKDIPTALDQLHPTRTIIFDDTEEILYVARGSEQNLDEDDFFARIRRYNLTELPEGGFPWEDGEIVATGVRNTVGMGFDKFGVLWGVDNGADSAFRVDLGGDINEDNPADELNRFAEMGKFFGYPYCFTEFILPDFGMGTGTQWHWGNLTEPYTDEWCRDPSNNTIPEVALLAHSAPLGITFYHYNETVPDYCPEGVAFPKEWDGDAFITYHGSYYRNVPIGAKVMRVLMTEEGLVDGGIDMKPSVIMEDMDFGAEWLSGVRPVDVTFDECGRLLVSSDGSYADQDGRMIILVQSYTAPPESPTSSPIASSPTSSPATASDSSRRGGGMAYILFGVALLAVAFN